MIAAWLVLQPVLTDNQTVEAIMEAVQTIGHVAKEKGNEKGSQQCVGRSDSVKKQDNGSKAMNHQKQKSPKNVGEHAVSWGPVFGSASLRRDLAMGGMFG